MSTNPNVSGQDECVKTKVKKKNTTRKKTVEDYYLNLEPFREKGTHKYLFKMYNNLKIDSTAKIVIRFFHGIYFKDGNTEIHPCLFSIAEQADITRDGAKKLLKRFLKSGYIIIKERFETSGRKVKQLSNTYHFTKLMEYPLKISELKKRIAKRASHLQIISKETEIGRKGYEGLKKMYEDLKKLEKAQVKMKKEILGLPIRESVKKGKDREAKREKKVKANALTSEEEKELQRLLRKKKVKLEKQKKKLNDHSKASKAPDTLENKYISFKNETPVPPPGVREDPQTDKATDKGTNHYNKTTENVCNSSGEKWLWVHQKALVEIFDFYEKSFGKTLDEDKKTEFQFAFEEYKMTKEEAIKRLTVFKNDLFLRRTNTSINRIFKFQAALEASRIVKENIKKAHCQFSCRFLANKVGEDIKHFKNYDEVRKYAETPVPYLKPFKSKVKPQEPVQPPSGIPTPKPVPSSDRSPFEGQGNTEHQLQSEPQKTISEQWAAIKQNECEKAKQANLEPLPPKKEATYSEVLLVDQLQKSGLNIAESKQTPEDRIKKLLSKTTGDNPRLYQERLLTWGSLPKEIKDFVYESIHDGRKLIQLLKQVKEGQ